ncbi:unnamed protein product [Cuscuta campestris]|uniref:SWIM-type domain-containing protein n=1 Tax=Cuscuta campestris TaxID=132261 RepID=A0A484MRP8_9ASTE|nr:unnamed protein product [Cuscuta campestris]
MQQWFHDRSEIASSTRTRLFKKCEALLIQMQREAFRMKVNPSCPYEFEVIDFHSRSYVVNLKDKTCTSCEFQLDQFVCVHAVATIGRCPDLSCHDFISPFYKIEVLVCTYVATVHPIGNLSSWDVPQQTLSIISKPPPCDERPPGRPKKRLYLCIGEGYWGQRHGKQKCSRCKWYDHNKKSCRHPIPSVEDPNTI